MAPFPQPGPATGSGYGSLGCRACAPEKGSDRRWRWLTWRSHLDDDDAGKMGGTPPQPEGTADRHGRRRPALQSQEALPMAPARANPRPRLVTAAQPGADRPGTGLREVEAQIVEGARSEEHTSELQSLMRISYAGF